MGILIFLALFIVIVLLYVELFPETDRFARFRKARLEQEFNNSKLVGVLLGLGDAELQELFTLYKKEFGRGAAYYARKTYRKWKTGEVQPAAQTYQRFLVQLPRVMNYDLKCEVLRHFMQEYAARDSYELKVSTADWEEKLTPLVRQIIDKTYTAQLPVEVERKLRWLGEGDMQAAREILRRSQAEEGRIAAAQLREEFAAIENLLADAHRKAKVTHELKFPYGTITLYIKKGK